MALRSSDVFTLMHEYPWWTSAFCVRVVENTHTTNILRGARIAPRYAECQTEKSKRQKASVLVCGLHCVPQTCMRQSTVIHDACVPYTTKTRMYLLPSEINSLSFLTARYLIKRFPIQSKRSHGPLRFLASAMQTADRLMYRVWFLSKALHAVGRDKPSKTKHNMQKTRSLISSSF